MRRHKIGKAFLAKIREIYGEEICVSAECELISQR